MARLVGVDLPREKRIEIALTYIFGVGRTRANKALSETGVFPKMLVQMVAVGERSGRLAQLLTSFAARMEEEVDARLKALVSIVEPLMIVVMGLIVGVITTSIIMPIYSVVQNIK